ncbi:hypothetical protein PCYB_002370 [Plasmodium cynomolgi strain B]|uniref:CYIR protein n=1 Tax=Plasmodium cynomolgi (strain B) TaxID=1120755 RepID=K6UNH3_PLACD|nr:hypothetical protein PCYB_002370 [Plasmodium cynomolgi strain B]GAB69488.1 hypothetical protein PCYB_002370 [Plasmodium cynomolgi strain B]
MKYKKELYDFLEYYEYKKYMIDNKQHSPTECCKYIWNAFEIYKIMHSDFNSYYSGYYDKEIEKFKNVFANVKKELDYIEEKCDNNNLDLVFDKTKNVIRLIKENETKEVEFLEKGSSLFNFYLELDDYYAKGSTVSCGTSDDKYFMQNLDFCKIWHSIQEILRNWNRINLRFMNFTYNKKCDYLNYWLYDKVKDNNDTRNIIPFLYEIRNLFTGKGYCNSKRYEFLVEQLENKKILHDFVEYYDFIKGKLIILENTGRESYCKYMKVFFDLYKDMEQNKSLSQGYKDEINYFKAKFTENIDELNFINSKCPGKCLNYIFSDKYKIFCGSKEGQNIGDLSDGAESCITENNFIPHYGSNEKDYIPNDSDLDKAYKLLDEDDTNVYYKQYCTKLKSFECQHKGVRNICHKLVKNLMHLSEMPINTKRDERCYLLKHWLYRELRKIYSSNFNDVSREPVITILKEVFFYINNKYLSESPCYIFFDDTMNKWKEDKELHDYFQIYKDIYNKISTIPSEKTNYCKYVSHIYGLYKKYIKNCCEYYYNGNHYNDNCSDYFNCDKKYDPNNLLIKLDCSSKLSDEESQKIYNVATIDRLVKLITEKSQEQSKLLSKLITEKSQIQPELLDKSVTVKPHEQSELIFKDKIVLITSKNLFSALFNDPFYVAILGCFGLLGIFFIFFCFYKVNRYCFYKINTLCTI